MFEISYDRTTHPQMDNAEAIREWNLHSSWTDLGESSVDLHKEMNDTQKWKKKKLQIQTYSIYTSTLP